MVTFDKVASLSIAKIVRARRLTAAKTLTDGNLMRGKFPKISQTGYKVTGICKIK
jgi:hypothetical protein